MKIVGVIPARYASSRFPGKPLADICGKPMLWWVYKTAKSVSELDEVYVATDDERIFDTVISFGGKAIMTSKNCETCTDRIAEVSDKISADIYVSILGDEPLLSTQDISSVINLKIENPETMCSVICRKIDNPIDAINTTTQKFVLNNYSDVIYISRQPIPYPQQTVDYVLYKHVGIYVFSKEALKFFSEIPMGFIETIEGNDVMRFIENRKAVKAIVSDNYSLSVDTPKDLDIVKRKIQTMIDNGEIKI
jgi:3-deoxy-manno-octulosonate cytidylyltransferase (CMP-KDO synthetase)